MLSSEQFHQQQFYQHTFNSEASSVESYPAGTMDYYHNTTAYNNNFPFAFADGTAVEGVKLEMVRTPSHHSLQNAYEYSIPMLSAGSIGSASSSTVGSPYSGPASMVPMQGTYALPQNYSEQQAIFYKYPEHGSVDDFTFMPPENEMVPDCNIVDPTLLSEPQFYPHIYSHPSPTPSEWVSHSATHNNGTRESSVVSRGSVGSPSVSGDDMQKDCCGECGKHFKDLKAHRLTHQATRPEKCPIVNCDYHTKGFSRKYDKNRHVLTHYRGTMVCGFCPNSGSSAEKTFNRADVFKRHLTSMHHVEQTPPNSRKRSPSNSDKKLSSYCKDATGKCPTCSSKFNNAQELYDHLDKSVLSAVQQEEPSEAFNDFNMNSVLLDDQALQESFDRNGIKPKQEDIPQAYGAEYDDDEEDEDDEDDNEDEIEEFGNSFRATKSGSRAIIGGNITKSRSNKKSMTWSKIGVPLVGKNRKRRKDYPPAWGVKTDNMKMKKRVLCVYDGPHRLNKDDMMLSNEYEVRLTLPDGHSWVTDLDVETMKRAEGFHNATPEEKVPIDSWIPAQELFTDGLF